MNIQNRSQNGAADGQQHLLLPPQYEQHLDHQEPLSLYTTGQTDGMRSRESTQRVQASYLIQDVHLVEQQQKPRMRSEYSTQSIEKVEDHAIKGNVSYNTAPTNFDAKMNERCLSLDLENLHELLGSANEWINIQQTIKTSIRYLLNISVQQQNQINHINSKLEGVGQLKIEKELQ